MKVIVTFAGAFLQVQKDEMQLKYCPQVHIISRNAVEHFD